MQHNTQPRLSVIMSVYNGEEHLDAAIGSILTQTFVDFEFVIVNDGSTDGSRDIIARFAAHDARIRLIDQANAGLTQALRNGVAAAGAPLIARMDADDLSTPDRFERQVRELGERPECVAVTCHIEHFRDDGSIKMIAKNIGPEPLIPLYNSFSNRIGGHGQVMFRRTAYDKAGGYDPAFRYSQDYDLWSRLLDIGGFGIVEDVLYKWRVGHGSITDRNKDAQIDCALRIACREHEKLTGVAIGKSTAQALIDFWWARKPENTPIADTIRASRAMDRAIGSFFRKHRDLAHHERDVRRSIMRGWRWRIPLADKTNLLRRGLLAGHVLYWALSGGAFPGRTSAP